MFATIHYGNLVEEVANWEDFSVEGTGAQGCCGVDPSLFTGLVACQNACKFAYAGGQCPDPPTGTKSIGLKCTYAVNAGLKQRAQRTCCKQCCYAVWGGAYKALAAANCKGTATKPMYGAQCGVTPTLAKKVYVEYYCRGIRAQTVTRTNWGGGFNIFVHAKNAACSP